jgi:outer membrane protein, heavy metal efflux system
MLLFCVSPLSTASAQDGNFDSLTLRQAVAMTVKNNPELAAVDWTVKGHLAASRQASRWDNPELEIEVEEFGIDRSWGAESDFTVAITQSFPLGSRRSKESAARRAAARTERARGEVAKAQLLARLRMAFYHAVAARERAAVQAEAYVIAQQVFESVQARIEAGDIPPAELQRAHTDILRSKLALQDARAEYLAALGALAVFWSGKNSAISSVSGSLPVPQDSFAPPSEPTNPHLQLVAAQTDQAQAVVALEQSKSIPDLTVGLGYQGLQGFQDSALVLLFSVPIPAFDRNGAGADAARAEKRALEFQARGQANRLDSSLAVHVGRRAASAAKHRALVSSLLPSVQKTYAKVQEGFAEGRFGTLDLLEAKKQLIETRFTVIDAALEYNLAQAQVAYLAGDLAFLTSGENHE